MPSDVASDEDQTGRKRRSDEEKTRRPDERALIKEKTIFEGPGEALVSVEEGSSEPDTHVYG